MQSPFQLQVDPKPTTQEEMIPLLDAEVAIFNRWLLGQGMDPLLRIEETMFRTYLLQKFRGRLDGDPSG